MMQTPTFVDYYETLELSPNAEPRTIERVFRHLASCYHPDNKETGDRTRFDSVIEAYSVLRDPEKRAAYDVHYKSNSKLRWHLAEEAVNGSGRDRDVDIQNRLLTVLYAKRRRDIREPGIGDFELERLLDRPAEHLAFHFWYLKEKGWIAKTENGTIAITVEGVDRMQTEHHAVDNRKQLADQSQRAQA
jgi:curved DNA-binding protein CbpA